ncbi:hypothetical protein OAL15_01180 [Flavobacteriales bacterium]|nr:hypothetical protein [Flavobacteriales bacterium]
MIRKESFRDDVEDFIESLNHCLYIEAKVAIDGFPNISFQEIRVPHLKLLRPKSRAIQLERKMKQEGYSFEQALLIIEELKSEYWIDDYYPILEERVKELIEEYYVDHINPLADEDDVEEIITEYMEYCDRKRNEIYSETIAILGGSLEISPNETQTEIISSARSIPETSTQEYLHYEEASIYIELTGEKIRDPRSDSLKIANDLAQTLCNKTAPTSGEQLYVIHKRELRDGIERYVSSKISTDSKRSIQNLRKRFKNIVKLYPETEELVRPHLDKIEGRLSSM